VPAAAAIITHDHLRRVALLILVTGGAGFIGSHVVDELVDAGMRVRVLDLLHPAAHRTRPDYLNEGAEYVWGDVADLSTVEAALNGIEAVSHQAAMVGLGVNFDDVEDYVRHNDLGTAVLLRALHRTGFTGRFVHGSSMVVYGEGAYVCPTCGPQRPPPRSAELLRGGTFDPPCPGCGASLEPTAVTEDAPLDPRNVYAATKVHQEDLSRAFAREHDVSLVVLRYHNVYGPRMARDTPYAGVAAIFRSALEARRSPEVFEDGRQLRDFVHVRDVARANVLALRSSVSGAFNVCSGDPRSVGDMAEALADAFDVDGLRPQVVGGFRPGDVRHVFASAERAASALGFRAEVGCAAGMREFATAALR
jgi:dTDP-L-rhamnose 4-epimerase